LNKIDIEEPNEQKNMGRGGTTQKWKLIWGQLFYLHRCKKKGR